MEANPQHKIIEVQPTQATEREQPTAPEQPTAEEQPTAPEQPTASEEIAVPQQPTATSMVHQQPNQPIQQMGVANHTQNVVIVNQSQQEKQQEKQLERPWSTGLCDCFSDCTTCCFGCFCMPCLMFTVADRLSESCFVAYRLDGGLLALRTKLRVKFNIQGSICNDACILCCCTQLAVCQMNRELDHVGL